MPTLMTRTLPLQRGAYCQVCKLEAERSLVSRFCKTAVPEPSSAITYKSRSFWMMNSSASTLLPSSVHWPSKLTETVVVGTGVVGAAVGAGAVVGAGVVVGRGVVVGARVVGGQSRLGSATNWSTGTRENHWPPSPCLLPTIRAPPQPLSLATHASRACECDASNSLLYADNELVDQPCCRIVSLRCLLALALPLSTQ